MPSVSYALNAKKGSRDDGESETFDVNIVAYMPHRTLQKDGSVLEGFAARPVVDALHGPTGVRRLTPIECERLQGLPDNWTRLDAKTPDSRRYSALGDAVTATVSFWIGLRLEATT